MSEHLMKYNVHSQSRTQEAIGRTLLPSLLKSARSECCQDEEITYSGEYKPDVDQLLVQGNIRRDSHTTFQHGRSWRIFVTGRTPTIHDTISDVDGLPVTETSTCVFFLRFHSSSTT